MAFLSISLIASALVINHKSTEKRQHNALANIAKVAGESFKSAINTDLRLLAEIALRDDICIPGNAQLFAAHNAAVRLNFAELVVAQTGLDYKRGVGNDKNGNNEISAILNNSEIQNIIKTGNGKYTALTKFNGAAVLVYAVPVFFTDDSNGVVLAFKSVESLMNDFALNRNIYESDKNSKIYFYFFDADSDLMLTIANDTPAIESIKYQASGDINGYPWRIFAATETNIFTDDLNIFKKFFILFAIAFCVLSFALVPVISKSIVLPIQGTSNILKLITMGQWGNANIETAMDLYSYDELMTIPSHFSGTIEKINNLIREMKYNSGVLCDVSSTLAVNISGIANVTEQFTKNIDNVKIEADKQCVSIDEITDYSKQLSDNIDAINNTANVQAGDIEKSMSLANEFWTDLEPVLGSIATNTGNINLVVKCCELGVDQLQTIMPDIKNIVTEFANVLSLNDQLQYFFKHADLQSLTKEKIEEEINKTNVISGALKEISTSIIKIEACADGVIKKFEEIDANTKNIKVIEEEVDTNIKSRKAVAQALVNAITQIRDVNGEVKEIGGTMMQGCDYIKTESAYLKLLATTVLDGIKETVLSSKGINESVTAVKNISLANKEKIFFINEELFSK
ncbi:hypothetical protein FACS1894102_1030 [Spirochaetia bacterium]|nr:hypothetical protein FACS1894102_1030 [Spirochaetia bacterium]